MSTEDILCKSESDFIPRLAIILYRDNTNENYLEMHEIDRSGQLLAGAPLTTECIAEIASQFSADQGKVPYGAVPANMLYFDMRKGYERYVWYNPPQQRMMYFKKELKIEDQKYFVPGVIYEVKDDGLNIYAYKGLKPTPKKQLYKAPFFNTTDGNVCLGHAKISRPSKLTFANFIEYWEKKFWLTEFSHMGGADNPTKSNLVAVTKRSVKSFDENQLLPLSRLTVDKLVKDDKK